MASRLRAHLTYANVVSSVCLFVVLGGSSYAAISLSTNSVKSRHIAKGAVKRSDIGKNAVNSSKVKDQSLRLKDFKAGQLPAGPRGPQGLPGTPGAAGPSHGYSTSFDADVTLEAAGTQHTLMSLTVPTGDYIVIARLQGKTGNDNPGGNDYRYDCTLAGAASPIDDPIDDPIYRVGETHGAENYLTFEGGYTGGGPITLRCRSANSHTLTAVSGSMVAIAVGGLN